MNGCLVDVPGIKVGTATDEQSLTGCTVVLTEEGAVAGAEVRGAAPGTRETDLLQPVRLVEKIQGLLLSGGSAFGLDAAAGVMDYLEEQGRGVQVGPFTVPIIPAAVIFDLFLGEGKERPDRAMGYLAAQQAVEMEAPQGSVGAGTGATVGKIWGMDWAVKSGQGTAARRSGKVIVGALVVVNAFGDVFSSKGEQLGGPFDKKSGQFFHTAKLLTGGDKPEENSFNTTLGVVATNASLNKEGVNKMAQMAHDGLARAIWPVHTLWDGDTVFALSLGNEEGDWNLTGVMAAEVIAEAVENALKRAASRGGVVSYQDIVGGRVK